MDRPGTGRRAGWVRLLAASGAILIGGCAQIPIIGSIETAFRGQAQVEGKINASVDGPIKIEIPPAVDPGPMVAVPVRAGVAGIRVGIVDIDGLLLNQNLAGLYSVGENPVAAFREKLEAAASDPTVRAVVVRVNSPGGSVTASDIMAEELRRFREASRKPVVSCLMDLGTSGAYYVAIGADRVIAHPTTVVGGVGALINHWNLQDAMGQLAVRGGPIKSGPLVDVGSVTGELPEPAQKLLQEMVDGLRDRFRDRLAGRRPSMTEADRAGIADGRVLPATKAMEAHLVDRIGYLHDALDEAAALAGCPGAEAVIFQRKGYPAHSVYAVTPNAPIDGQILPFSYPGLDRAKIPTFLYLWEPDPTIVRLGGR